MPDFCKLRYTCTMEPIPNIDDLCSRVESNLSAVFNPDLVTYRYSINSLSQVPVGDYQFIIKAIVISTEVVN